MNINDDSINLSQLDEDAILDVLGTIRYILSMRIQPSTKMAKIQQALEEYYED